MVFAFIQPRLIDYIDIIVVAILMYQFYYLIKGTVAFNIFMTIVAVLIINFIVVVLDMKLLSSILGKLISGGVIALIIVYQQEIRRFLIYVGSRYLDTRRLSLDALIRAPDAKPENLKILSIQKACKNLAATNTGALIVIARESSMDLYTETGDIVNARLSSRILESIFFKNSPLHDGAVILKNNTIVAARCVLPFTSSTSLSPVYGMRHKAGIGISEDTDAFVVIVSEERGEISIAERGQLTPNISVDDLWQILNKKFIEFEEK